MSRDSFRAASLYNDASFFDPFDEGVDQSMKEATKRSIFRWIHIVFAIPIAGYVYSPFKELPNYAPVVRFVAIPVIVLTGFWMWKGPAVRRLISKIGRQ
jgi:hypothetical protein